MEENIKNENVEVKYANTKAIFIPKKTILKKEKNKVKSRSILEKKENKKQKVSFV